MEVSWNRGTPKSSILVAFSIINQPFGGIPIYGNPLHGNPDIASCKTERFAALGVNRSICDLVAEILAHAAFGRKSAPGETPRPRPTLTQRNKSVQGELEDFHRVSLGFMPFLNTVAHEHSSKELHFSECSSERIFHLASRQFFHRSGFVWSYRLYPTMQSLVNSFIPQKNCHQIMTSYVWKSQGLPLIPMVYHH